jgi:drug/metabolite transporter (DMT)-like permease
VVAVLLALGAGVAWGVSDFLGGVTSRRLALVTVMLVSQAVGFLLVLPLALASGPPALDTWSAFAAMAGSLAGLVGIAALYRGMAVGTVSIVAPISATGAAIPIALGFVRGERATVLQSVGIVLALIGIVLAARTPPSPSATSSPRASGIGYALVAALGFGAFFALLHEASISDLFWASAVQRGTGVVTLSVAALLVRPNLTIGWPRLPRLVLIGVLDTSANVLYAGASTRGMVSIAAVLASLFPVVTVLLARVVLHERIGLGQSIGVLCALGGVALIALP